MREFLQNVEKGSEGDDVLNPLKSAQKGMKPQLPKRFYKGAEVAEVNQQFTVLLDGRNLRTPGKNLIEVPTRQLADILCSEWEAQEKEIDPLKMPATRLVNTAIDGIATDPQAVFEDILKFSGSDLLCYRADGPQDLIDRQNELWDPLIEWARDDLGANFILAEGIIHAAQPKEALAAFGSAMKRHKQPLKLAVLHTFTSLTGSAIIALALAEGYFGVEDAWAAAHVDEDWNASLWGEDFEAKARREKRWSEMQSAHAVFAALDSTA